MTAGPLKAKATKVFLLDYPLTGCAEGPNAAEPYVCPKGPSNPGYLASDSAGGVSAMATAERMNGGWVQGVF